jgi:hypothetical protein
MASWQRYSFIYVCQVVVLDSSLTMSDFSPLKGTYISSRSANGRGFKMPEAGGSSLTHYYIF